MAFATFCYDTVEFENGYKDLRSDGVTRSMRQRNPIANNQIIKINNQTSIWPKQGIEKAMRRLIT